jgi:hypothetical protein
VKVFGEAEKLTHEGIEVIDIVQMSDSGSFMVGSI